jgi:hypothetical protein
MSGGVEFLPEEFADEPAPPPEPGPPPRRRLAGATRLAAVVIAIAVLGTWIATRPSGSPARTPAAQGTQAPTTPAPAPTPPRRSWTRSIDDVQIIRCSTGAGVPTGVLQAMHRFLPGIVVAKHRASRCVEGPAGHRRTVARSVSGRYDGLTIEVSLSGRTIGFAPSHQLMPANHPVQVLGAVETESAGIKVRVSAASPKVAKVPGTRMQRLADYLCLNTVL